MQVIELINRMGLGGAERMAATLSLALQASGHSVHILCVRDFDDSPVPRQTFLQAGVRIVELGKPDGFSVQTLRTIADYCQVHNADVIHGHTHQVNHYAVAAAQLAGVSAVVNTVHGISALDMQWWAKVLFRMSCIFTGRVVGVCDEVSEAVRNRFLLPVSKTEIIYNGIFTPEYLSIPLREPDNPFVFGTVGRLVPVKNQRSLISAFASVHREQPATRLEILGTGELQSELEAYASELGVERAVKFCGFSVDVGAFLSRIDCFVLSSLSEGLPMALLEAMAASRPVVATSVGGVTEIVVDSGCGWLCPAHDDTALADAMHSAMQAPDRAQRGLLGRKAVLQRYTAEAMAAYYTQLFERLVQEAGRKPFSVNLRVHSGTR